MDCWNCGKVLPDQKITFRASCEACYADLHCCKNCKFYKPGLPNDCMVPGTDYIADRAKSNLCEEFSAKGIVLPPSKNPDAKKRFNDLFKD
jgi:hypothetical protein